MNKILAIVIAAFICCFALSGCVSRDSLDSIKDSIIEWGDNVFNYSGNADDGNSVPQPPPEDHGTGFAELDSSMGKLVSTPSRGSYFELDTNKTYSFVVDLEKTFGSADVTILCDLDARGSAYFWDCYGTDSGYFSNVDGGVPTLRTLSSVMDRFAEEVSVTGNIVTIKTGYRSLPDSYSYTYSDSSGYYTCYADRFCYQLNDSLEPDLDGTGHYYPAGVKECAMYNMQHYAEYLFFINLEASNGVVKYIPFWLPAAYFDYAPY